MSNSAVKTVFIGVGHGGKDPGAVANGLCESDVNLTMALAMKVELERHDVKVGISRTSDVTVGLAKEVALCNAFRPDLAVECHDNFGCGKTGKGGFEAYRQETGKYAAESLRLARAIEKRVVAGVPTTSRGIKGEMSPAGGYKFGWLNCNCPSVLCEGAFLDSDVDSKRLTAPGGAARYGVMYAHGVLDFFGIPVKGSTPAGGKPTISQDKPVAITVGSNVMITGDQYSTGQVVPLWARNVPHVVSRIDGGKALLGHPDGINSWVAIKDLKRV